MITPRIGFDWQLVKATFRQRKVFVGSLIALLLALCQIWTVIKKIAGRSYREVGY